MNSCGADSVSFLLFLFLFARSSFTAFSFLSFYFSTNFSRWFCCYCYTFCFYRFILHLFSHNSYSNMYREKKKNTHTQRDRELAHGYLLCVFFHTVSLPLLVFWFADDRILYCLLLCRLFHYAHGVFGFCASSSSSQS